MEKASCWAACTVENSQSSPVYLEITRMRQGLCASPRASMSYNTRSYNVEPDWRKQPLSCGCALLEVAQSSRHTGNRGATRRDSTRRHSQRQQGCRVDRRAGAPEINKVKRPKLRTSVTQAGLEVKTLSILFMCRLPMQCTPYSPLLRHRGIRDWAISWWKQVLAKYKRTSFDLST